MPAENTEESAPTTPVAASGGKTIQDRVMNYVYDLTQRMASVHDDKLMSVKIVIELLREHEVKCLVVTYEGSGDSGQIESSTVIKEPCDPADFFSVGVDVDEEGTARLSQAQFTDELKAKYAHMLRYWTPPMTLLELIENLSTNVTPMGYEINEGGQGVLVFDAVTGECQCEHGSNYSEINYETECITLPKETMPKFKVEYGFDVPAYGQVEIEAPNIEALPAKAKELYEAGQLIDDWDTYPEVGCENHRVVHVFRQDEGCSTWEQVPDLQFSLDDEDYYEEGEYLHIVVDKRTRQVVATAANRSDLGMYDVDGYSFTKARV